MQDYNAWGFSITHELIIDEQQFDNILNKNQCFLITKHIHDFRVGDRLHLTIKDSNETYQTTISSLYSHHSAMAPGYLVLGFRNVDFEVLHEYHINQYKVGDNVRIFSHDAKIKYVLNHHDLPHAIQPEYVVLNYEILK